MNIFLNTHSDKRPPTWIFAAQPRMQKEIKPQTIHIEAETEREARRLLAPTHICFFAGCIRH